jgi:hypothetical protein
MIGCRLVKLIPDIILPFEKVFLTIENILDQTEAQIEISQGDRNILSCYNIQQHSLSYSLVNVLREIHHIQEMTVIALVVGE